MIKLLVFQCPDCDTGDRIWYLRITRYGTVWLGWECECGARSSSTLRRASAEFMLKAILMVMVAVAVYYGYCWCMELMQYLEGY